MTDGYLAPTKYLARRLSQPRVQKAAQKRAFARVKDSATIDESTRSISCRKPIQVYDRSARRKSLPTADLPALFESPC